MSVELERHVNGADADSEKQISGDKESTAMAFLIEYGSGRYIALPPHVTYALIEKPAFLTVPGVADYAYGLLVWQGRYLPFIDLNTFLHVDSRLDLNSAPNYALIVAYQSFPHCSLEYGAIALPTLPRNITVCDKDQCNLPDDWNQRMAPATSCFLHEGRPVPIVDTSRMFNPIPVNRHRS